MAESQMNEEMRRDLNYLSSRLNNLESQMSELKVSVKLTLDNLLPKVETVLANQGSNISNSVVIETLPGNVASCMSLIQAAQGNDVEAILRFLSRDDVDIKKWNEGGDSALHVAAKAGHERAVSVLLGNIPVDFASRLGRTALHYASEDGHLTIVRQLLNAGANADAKDSAGNFPLLLAAKAGHVDIVKQLKKHNASLDLVDRDGNSSIVAAAKSKHWEIVEFLVDHGASPGKYKGNGNSPLCFVADEKKYDLLAKMLTNTEKKYKAMKFVLWKCYDPHLVNVFESSAPGFCRSQEGRDTLYNLARYGKVDVLRAMLDRGADVDGLHSHHGESCLISAALHGQASVMKLLLERGATVDLRHSRVGGTALHCAAQKGQLECVHLLLGAQAAINIKDRWSQTPLDLAVTKEIRDLLIFND